jgi:glycosyltransferase involved in cell wall biosynthesis
MKVLIVSPVPTDPPVAGNRARVAALFAALVRLGHDVTFAYVPYEIADYHKMRQRLGDRLRILQTSAPPFESVAARLRRKVKRKFGFNSAHLWRVDEWFDESLLPQILRLQERECFEAVLIEYVYLSKLACGLPTSVRTIIDTHDLMGDRHKQYLTAGMQPTWFATKPAEEISALSRADAIIAIQEEEAEYLRRTVSSEVFVVGPLIGLDVSPPPDPGGARILFVGSSNPINVQGLEWFVGSVFPKIRKEMPNSEVAIAGPVGHERSWPDGTIVLGNLDSLAKAYADATLVINPVRFGTGAPIKTIEALSYGKAVVATPAGVRGLEADFYGAVSIVESPDEFAEKVLELLESKAARPAMSRKAIAASDEWQRRQLAMLHAAITGQRLANQIGSRECRAETGFFEMQPGRSV